MTYGFNLFERIEAVQFNHRTVAYLVLAAAGVFVWRALKAGRQTMALMVGGAVLLQVLLGIWTIVAAVPLWLGLAHQAGALLILASVVYAVYGLTGSQAGQAAGAGRPLHPQAEAQPQAL